jgi:hypothetical protein
MLINRLPAAFQLLVGLSILKTGVILFTALIFVDSAIEYLFSLKTMLDFLIVAPFLFLAPMNDSKFICNQC